MVDKKISECTTDIAMGSTDLFVMVDMSVPETKSIYRHHALRPIIKNTTSGLTIATTDGYDAVFIKGASALTLPSASISRTIRIQKMDTSGVSATVERAGGDTIQGATNLTLTFQYDSVVLISNGSSHWGRF